MPAGTCWMGGRLNHAVPDTVPGILCVLIHFIVKCASKNDKSLNDFGDGEDEI